MSIETKLLPFILLIVTILLMLPHRFLKKRYKKYTQQMKEVVWIDTIDRVSNDEIRTKMVELDKALQTTKIREETYNAFVNSFVDAYIEFLNNSDFTKKTKIKKINQTIQTLTMNFSVPSLDKLTEAKDKLEGNVEL